MLAVRSARTGEISIAAARTCPVASATLTTQTPLVPVNARSLPTEPSVPHDPYTVPLYGGVPFASTKRTFDVGVAWMKSRSGTGVALGAGAGLPPPPEHPPTRIPSIATNVTPRISNPPAESPLHSANANDSPLAADVKLTEADATIRTRSGLDITDTPALS
jgi:hypothetical protein